MAKSRAKGLNRGPIGREPRQPWCAPTTRLAHCSLKRPRTLFFRPITNIMKTSFYAVILSAALTMLSGCGGDIAPPAAESGPMPAASLPNAASPSDCLAPGCQPSHVIDGLAEEVRRVRVEQEAMAQRTEEAARAAGQSPAAPSATLPLDPPVHFAGDAPLDP